MQEQADDFTFRCYDFLADDHMNLFATLPAILTEGHRSIRRVVIRNRDAVNPMLQAFFVQKQEGQIAVMRIFCVHVQ